MTALEPEVEQEIERPERAALVMRPERASLVRQFDAVLREIGGADGRTVDMRIVPFGETATVADGLGGLPPGEPYQEEWMPGCFDKQLRAADKIYLNFQHEPGLAGIVGKGMMLRSAADGYHATFRMLSGQDSDKALELIHEGVLTGASIEVPARTLRSVRSKSGVIQRVKGHLDSVALCRIGAFASALVTAVREDDIVDADLLPADMSPEIVERLEKLGIEIPSHVKAGEPSVEEKEPEIEVIDLRAIAARADTPDVNRLDAMIAMAQNYISGEPDQPDRAAMQAILSQLRSLRAKEAAEPSAD